VAVGAQDVGQHVSIARVRFAARRAITGAAGFHYVGVDRNYRVPGLDQRIDDYPPSRARSPRRAFDGDWQLGRECYLAQPGKHVDETCIIVPDLDAGDNLTGAIHDADGVGDPAPVQTSVKWHVLISLGCGRLTRAGRSCGSLTDRRSGRQALALHPVVRRYLPAPAVRLVSVGPSNGKHAMAVTADARVGRY
jgi:hypothetical protein